MRKDIRFVLATLSLSGWQYGLVKADHYRPIEEQNLIQPLLTIPVVVGM